MDFEGKATDCSLVYFLKRLIKRFIDDDVSALSAECTYYFILGMVPFLIFIVNAMLFFAAPQMNQILKLIEYLPPDIGKVFELNVARIIRARSSIWMFAGLGAALWTASQGVDTMIRSADRAFFGDRNLQSYLRVKTKSIIFTLFISFGMILSLGLIVFANAVIYAIAYYFSVAQVFLDAWTVLKFGFPFVIIAFSLAAFYQFAPAQTINEWRKIIVAAFLVTSIWIGLTYAYGYYMLHISSMGITYGSLVGLIVLFIWFHLTAMVIIAGGEFIMAWKETGERHKEIEEATE